MSTPFVPQVVRYTTYLSMPQLLQPLEPNDTEKAVIHKVCMGLIKYFSTPEGVEVGNSQGELRCGERGYGVMRIHKKQHRGFSSAPMCCQRRI